MPPRSPGKGYFKTFFYKALPQLFQPAAAQPRPFRYHAVSVIFFG
jgi:hypothetical protein